MEMLIGELETWKQKFMTLNRDFNNVKQELIKAQAEVERVAKKILNKLIDIAIELISLKINSIFLIFIS